MTRLVERAQAGDRHALEAAVAQLAPLAYGLAREYWAPGMERDDLRQEALIGLAQGIRRWDASKGALVGFCAMCITRRLKSSLTAAHRRKHSHLNDARSLSETARDSEGLTLAETVAGPLGVAEHVAQREVVRSLRHLPTVLTEIEGRALSMFLNGHPYEHIAQTLGVDRKAIDNALGRARKKARALVAA